MSLLTPCTESSIQFDRLVGFEWPMAAKTGIEADDYGTINITPCWEGLYAVIIEAAQHHGRLSGGGGARLLRVTETVDGPIGQISINIDLTCEAVLGRDAFANYNGAGDTPLAPFIGISVVNCDARLSFSGIATIEWEFATERARRIECNMTVELTDVKTIELTPLGYSHLVVHRSHLSGSVSSITATTASSE
ncbi:MAG: hypothetical protein IPK67_18350 [Planctomycetes bacterium]|nr:hypothetical protein [Planctomycetota bacterium]